MQCAVPENIHIPPPPPMEGFLWFFVLHPLFPQEIPVYLRKLLLKF